MTLATATRDVATTTISTLSTVVAMATAATTVSITTSRAPIAPCAAEASAFAGGEYRLCWCAASFPCSSVESFCVDVGVLVGIGPAPLQQRMTCLSGRRCSVEGVLGTHLSDGDRVLAPALPPAWARGAAMGTRDISSHRPRTGIECSGDNGETDPGSIDPGSISDLGPGVSWKGPGTRPDGFRPRGAPPMSPPASPLVRSPRAAHPAHIARAPARALARTPAHDPLARPPVRMRARGPCTCRRRRKQHRGRPISERIPPVACPPPAEVQDTCGVARQAPGFPSAGEFSDVSASGAVLRWSAASTAAGGEYRLCWCGGRPGNSSCYAAELFRVDFGALVVRGPRPLEQHRTVPWRRRGGGHRSSRRLPRQGLRG